MAAGYTPARAEVDKINLTPLLQTIGSVTVFALVALSGFVALALAAEPDTPLYWYLDREVFGVVRFAHGDFLPVGPIAAVTGLAGMSWAMAAHWRQWEFGAALATHASFLLVAQPIYAWFLLVEFPHARTASLVTVGATTHANLVTWLSIAATLLSMTARLSCRWRRSKAVVRETCRDRRQPLSASTSSRRTR